MIFPLSPPIGVGTGVGVKVSIGGEAKVGVGLRVEVGAEADSLDGFVGKGAWNSEQSIIKSNKMVKKMTIFIFIVTFSLETLT